MAALAASAAAQITPDNIVFSRVSPAPGQLRLFVASADGTNERPLLPASDADYDPVWSRDGAWIVFTSERGGSADLYRVKPDGTGLERLTDDPAYDDQASPSPDSGRLVFVSSRSTGRAKLWILDVRTRKATPLTSGDGADFRPAWSPDGAWIAFSSDRGSTSPPGHGRWERLELVDVYVIRPDGTGLKRLTEHGNFCGSPGWSADSRRVITYCMSSEQTLSYRFIPEPGETSLVSIDIASGSRSTVAAPAGVKMSPSFVGEDVGYVRKDVPASGIYYASGRPGPRGDIRAASWSPDGSQVVFHRRTGVPRVTWRQTWSRNPKYSLTLSQIFPAFNPTGDRFAAVAVGGGQVGSAAGLGSSILVAASGTDRSEIVYHSADRNVLAPAWSPRGDTIVFGVGSFGAFYHGFHDLFLKPEDRVDGGAQIATIAPDGSGFREITSGRNNNAFPSLAPDGRRMVYRTFGPDGEGLRIMNLDTKAVTTLTDGYDNFPLWSPRGDLIMFARQNGPDYQIYTIKPDGSGVRLLTPWPGNTAHMGWSPDGEHIVFASTRMGFKDEVLYTDAPQPSGELFVMRYDGSSLEQLTDNQWEEGTPSWQPSARAGSPR